MNPVKEEERHRVDRLLDRLGEQQLSLRQHVRPRCIQNTYICVFMGFNGCLMQDVSIHDLTERLKIIEGQGRRESEFLNEIKVFFIFYFHTMGFRGWKTGCVYDVVILVVCSGGQRCSSACDGDGCVGKATETVAYAYERV